MPMRRVTVDTGITQLWSYNPKRQTGTLKNTTATQLRISQDQSNILTDGFPVENGEVVSLSVRDGDAPKYTLYASVAAGTTTVQVYEGYGEDV